MRPDSGPEIISRSLDPWAYQNGMERDFIRPGKPTAIAFIESFKGKLRQKRLDQHCILSLSVAKILR